MRATRKFLILFPISQAFAFGTAAFAAMPTAALPIEPATSDKDLFGDQPPAPVKNPSEGAKAEVNDGGTQSLHARAPSHLGEFGTELRMQMSKESFGSQLKALQYAYPWLAVTEALRYFGNESDDRLFHKRYGVLVGLELHPWRSSLLLPYFNLQTGWEKFVRENDLEAIDSPVIEAAAGVELALGRFASLSAQWTEGHYTDVSQPLYGEDKGKNEKDFKRHAAAEVFFNLRWTY